MQNHEQRLQILWEKYTSATATEAELQDLFRIIESATDAELEVLIDQFFEATKEKPLSGSVDWDTMFGAIIQQPQDRKLPAKRKPLLWLAAAAVVVLAGLLVFRQLNQPKLSPVQAQNNTTANIVSAPSSSKAIVQLSNGLTIDLDTVKQGLVAIDNGMRIIKSADGTLSYENETGAAIATEFYNTVVNPKGSKVIDLVLSDGTQLWLNAGSSIRYPVVFLNSKRHVELNGEAYFEVAPNKAKPFEVVKGAMKVEVLGTHFNVNAYDDEPNIRVTLLEGAVNVYKDQLKQVLKPGQAAVVNGNGVQLIESADTDAAVAWINGLFQFDKASLQAVLRQLARWYNIEVKYTGAIPVRTFEGKIQNTLSLNDVLMILKQNNIKYKIENKTLIIEP